MATIVGVGRAKDGVDDLSYVVFDLAVEMRTHCLNDWQDRLLENSRFPNSAAN
jgi:hypothetical protein